MAYKLFTANEIIVASNCIAILGILKAGNNRFGGQPVPESIGPRSLLALVRSRTGAPRSVRQPMTNSTVVMQIGNSQTQISAA
jgi:hypothetical protein